MKTTIMEYGLLMIGAIVLAALLAGIGEMFSDGGGGRDAILNYINTIC